MSRCILVMSVGRSGSSGIAGMLHHLGVDMGREFEPADRNNAWGTYEDLAFVQLNRAFITGQATPQDYGGMDRDLPLWGIKDPQLCWTLEYLLPHLHGDVSMIIVRRYPDRIIDSYIRAYHHGINYAKNWFEGVNSALEKQIKNFDGPKLTVWWDDAIHQPTKTAKTLADFVGINDKEKIERAAKHIKRQIPEPGWGKVAIGVRVGKYPEPAFFESWTKLLTGGTRNSDSILMPRSYMARHKASNKLAKDFLRTDKDSLLMIDDDMAFEGDALEKLRSNPETYNYDMVFGFCTMRYWPPKPVIMKLSYEREEPESLGGEFYDLQRQFNDGDIIPVDAVGLAFTLIKRRVFEAMLHPDYGIEYTWWFDHEMPKESDEISFCRRARNLGFKMAVDTNVKIDHVGVKRYGWDDFQAWNNTMTFKSDELRPIFEYVAKSQNGLSSTASDMLRALEVFDG